MGVRFIHAADLHLGSPLEAVGAESERLQQQLREATYTAFERITDLALNEGVDFLLVAGDLYDQKNRSVRANEFLVEQFERLAAADIPAYIIYGNHDPLGEATTYIDLPPNVHEFGHEEASMVCYPDDASPEARIWGQSYRNEAESRKLHTGFTPTDGRVPNIGLLHTGLNPDGQRYVPCSTAELAQTDHLHYWALGHIHQARQYESAPPIVHPGIPQGRHTGELGPGGCVLVTLQAGGEAELEYVPTSPVIWHTHDIDISDANEFDLTTLDGIQRTIETTADEIRPDYESLEERLNFPVRQPEWDPAGYVCRWRLVGRGDANEFLSDTEEPVLARVSDRLRDSIGTDDPFVYTETVVDRTGPQLPDIEDLRDDDRVVDEFFELRDELEDDADARAAMRDQLDYDRRNNVWQRVEDPEEVDDDKLALTEDRLDDLIKRAEERVLNELVRRRAE